MSDGPSPLNDLEQHAAIPSRRIVRLADVCEICEGARQSPMTSKSVSATLAGVRLIRGDDLFSGAPFAEQPPSDVTLYHREPESVRIRRGDLLLPAVARKLRFRLVDSALEDCFAHHSVIILRPRSEAPPTSWLANFLSSKEFLETARNIASSLGDSLRLTPQLISEMQVALPNEAEAPSNFVIDLMDRLVRDVIRAIARNGDELRHVEWRILERVLATAFDDLGFDALLTPASKDGGKDIVLECTERGTRKRYIVEVKHWVSGKPVPGHHVKRFLHVVVNEKHDSGLFLSTSGFARNAFESLIHLEHKRVRVAERDKVLSLCELYVKRRSGLWAAERSPTDALFDQTRPL